MSRLHDMMLNIDSALVSVRRGVNENIDDIVWSLEEALSAAKAYRKSLIDTEGNDGRL